MKNTLYFIAFYSIVIPFRLSGQLFETAVFNDYQIEIFENINYGINASASTLPSLGEAMPKELNLDLYLPPHDFYDYLSPLVIILHDSYFQEFPNTYRPTGTKQDSSMVELCTRLAKYGYTAVSIDYRKWWNTLAAYQYERSIGLIQAIYRGIQDGRTAVRYFKKTVANNGNPYLIDTTKIAVIGIESAGFVATGMATLDNINKITNTTNEEDKFLVDLNNDGIPDFPMIDVNYHGDIEGKITTLAPDDLFGFPEGDTTCYSNHTEYNSDIQLAMHISGGILDIAWIDENSSPILSFQPYFGSRYPYYDDMYFIPGTPNPVFHMQGGHFIAERQVELGISPLTCEGVVEYTLEEEIIQNSQLAEHPNFFSLFPYENVINSSGFPEGVTIDWWDPNALSPPIDGFPNGIPWNQLPHPSGGTFHTFGLLTNEDMSAEKAKINIQKIIDFFAPHAHCILNLSPTVKTSELIPNEEIVVFPNPSSGFLNISAPITEKIYGIEMYNSNGQKVLQKDINGENEITLEHYSIPKGIYFLKILLEKNTLTRKVILTE